MKIFRITAQGLPLFKEDMDICFYTQQRVSEDDRNNLYNLIDNYYLHSACAFIGINASGKTSVLSYILKRNDIKKSDAYQSGFLEGTTPAYEAYMRLKKNLAASIK